MANETSRTVADRAHFGPSNWSETSLIEWIIHDFENLSQQTGEIVEGLPTLKCHGITWGLELFPHGCQEECSDCVSVFVTVEGGVPENCDEWMRYRFVYPGFEFGFSQPRKLKALASSTTVGSSKYLCREDLSTLLVDGALTIQAEIQVTEERPAPWTPKKTIGADWGKLLRSGEDADVTFVADGKSLSAHRLVLKLRSPTLYELCEDAPPGSEVPIVEVSAAIFEVVLQHVYTDDEPSAEFLAENARDLLDAADRFGCPRLKLLAEAELVRSGVNSENVVSLLLLADSKSCALLKEVAMNHIASDPTGAMASEDWSKVKESNALLVEIMEAAFGKKKTAAAVSTTQHDGGIVEYDALNVNTLRRKLDDAGLSGDGTREILVKRLKAHHDGAGDNN